jgi:heme a synthase
MTSTPTSRFLLWARITLVLVYAVIMAGAVVRATGSGMGCPDWPKCFGYYIPPTERTQIEFNEGKEFKKGSFIIWNEALWKAKHDLVAGKEVNPADWEKYTKHDYAEFNAAHTWTEYVNRLMGALLGIASFIALLFSFPLRKKDGMLVALSAVTVFLIGFEAWLGAKVVDSNLAPVKITTHMIVALIIVAVAIYTIHRARAAAAPVKVPAYLKILLITVLACSLLQTFFGTQVRENIDEIANAMDDQYRELWVEQLGSYFNIHRLFAIAVILLNALMVYGLYKNTPGKNSLRSQGVLLLVLLFAELAAGVVLARFGMPAAFQPVHLFLAALIFGLQCRMLMEMSETRVKAASFH